MKIPQSFSSHDLPAFTVSRRGRKFTVGRKSADTSNRKSSTVNRKSQEGIALVITLIMLAITLVMAVAFLALAQRERNSVTGTTDLTVARQAADSAVANAQAQINANILSGVRNGGSSNAYNIHLFVSTNYINSYGFLPGSSNPTNVNYAYLSSGGPLSQPNLLQNISNLWYLPRAPVYIPSNQPVTSYDFRYYLDLNQNGRYDTNYYGPDFDSLGNPLPGAFSLHVGDPEWIGVLEHPDAPHGPNNHFTSRFAFIAVPVGNTLDVNYLHNQVRNTTLTANDGYMRNQGVGSWEINLAAFLADLNTNMWGYTVGSGASAPAGSATYYQYNEFNNNNNSGFAFADARALTSYRYNNRSLASATALFRNPPATLFFNRFNTFDAYGDGPLQTTLDTNANWIPDLPALPWSGADNTNHFFTPSDFFDLTKTTMGVAPVAVAAKNDFTDRLKAAGNLKDTYDSYTFYRMLDALGTDSAADIGKINLNFSNAVVNYTNINGFCVPTSVNIVPGAETNLQAWAPQNFFNAAADKMLRAYSANWFQANPTNYFITYYGYVPRWPISADGQGVPDYPTYGIFTNQIPSFGITNIPVLFNSNFVYSPSINRLLQLAANLYDASTNGPVNGQFVNIPHVFRPIFEHDILGNVFIVGYTNLYSGNGPNTVSGPTDLQLAQPRPITDLPFLNAANTPITFNGALVNVYGVPWIIGAKKGLPNFNQMYMLNQAQVTRKLEVTRTSSDANTAVYTTNQMYLIGVSNSVGVTWWNSYNNTYPRPLKIYAADRVEMTMTNGLFRYPLITNLTTGGFPPGSAVTINPWQGSQWTGLVPNAVPNANSFVTTTWGFTFQNPLEYDWATGAFDLNPPVWQTTTPQIGELPQFGLLITNYLQAYILDGNYVVDYVQLRDPISATGLNQALADHDYPLGPNNVLFQWSTNIVRNTVSTPYGVANQLLISANPGVSDGGTTPQSEIPPGGDWATSATPMQSTTPKAESAYFAGFFVPNFQYNGQTYVNDQLSIQAPYTPTRTVYSSFLLQANDPLVHYTSSDLGAQTGATAVWQNQNYANGIWYQSDSASQPLPVAPQTPIKGRYQPWGAAGQMGGVGGTVDPNTYNLAYRDPLAWGPDYWGFSTNLYPSVGWIGRVHRGTPWQTVYLKSTNVLSDFASGSNGTNTWAQWTGDIQTINNLYYDSQNSAPAQDRLLFDIFTARFNDNASRGTLPVNQTQISAWSAVLSGLVAITNNNPMVLPGFAVTNTYLIANPAGVVNTALASTNLPPVWQIVDGPLGINATRANTNLFPVQSFVHAGDVLATPALSTYSPFLNNGSISPANGGFGKQQWAYGINDEEYEWLPQQIMGLVRATQPRYVLYCFGQTLRPAPNGTVLSGPYFQMVTNYQVTAESAIRAVIRIDGANTTTPHAVVESYNVLPPN